MSEASRLEIKVLPNEYWWGGLTRHGDRMPFSAAKPYRQSLYQNLMGNQGCPLLVSSRGRSIWSEEPFAIEFKDGWLFIDDALGAVVQGEGNGNLRGAYRDACQKFFPPSGRIPNPLSFTAPQYNSWIDVRKNPTQEQTLRYAQSILDAGFPPAF